MNLKYSSNIHYKNEMKRRLLYSVIVGMMATVLLSSRGFVKPQTQAWWGTLYPKYCYSQVTDDEDGGEREIRIRFRWLRGL